MTKNLLFSGIAGTIIYFLLGWLVYRILFPDLVSEGESNSLLYIFLVCLFKPLFMRLFSRDGLTLLILKQALTLD